MGLLKGQVVLKKGKRFWHYNVRSRNGQVTSTSQRFILKWNGKRAGRREANRLGYDFVEA